MCTKQINIVILTLCPSKHAHIGSLQASCWQCSQCQPIQILLWSNTGFLWAAHTVACSHKSHVGPLCFSPHTEPMLWSQCFTDMQTPVPQCGVGVYIGPSLFARVDFFNVNHQLTRMTANQGPPPSSGPRASAPPSPPKNYSPALMKPIQFK